MSLLGLPDFQKPLREQTYEMLYCFAAPGAFVLMPQGLALARREDDRPDFMLELVRGANPFLPPKPYGTLSFRLQPDYAMTQALALLRQQQSKGTLAPASFSTGFLRLWPDSRELPMPADLLAPVPITWQGLNVARFSIKLSTTTATLVENALQGELLPLRAWADLEIAGVSPRLPLQVRFDPAQLVEPLLARADAERRIARAELIAFFRAEISTLPLVLTGQIDETQRDEFAEGMTDRIRNHFALLTPTPEPGSGAYYRLAATEEVAHGKFYWDLAEPTLTWRPQMLALDPFTSARELVETYGLDAVRRRTVIANLNTGVLPVTITADLPSERSGLLAIGVTLRAPPHPPYRAQSIVETVSFESPTAAANVRLPLSPAELPEYSYQTFVVSTDGELTGETVAHRGEKLELTRDDFPVDFVAIATAANLLALADIAGVCRWQENGAQRETSFKVTPDQPNTTLLLPKGIQDAMLSLVATEHQGGSVIRIDDLATKNTLQLGLYLFPTYGPHAIDIECAFNDEVQLLVIDLLPEGRPETASEITLLHFTPQEPRKQWRWFAESPFQPGYRYRIYAGGAGTPTAWSQVRSPFEPLKLRAGVNNGPDGASDLNEIEFHGLRYYRSQSESNLFYYIPGNASPEKDTQGKPTLLLQIADDVALLQLDTRWAGDSALLEMLHEALVEQFPTLDPASLRLSFAPVTVEKVELLLREASDLTVLQTAVSASSPPYPAHFQAQLTVAQQDQVMAALHGRTDILQVRYTLTRVLETTASSGVEGKGQPPRQISFTRSADVGDWFTGDEGDDHIQIVPSLSPTPQSSKPGQ